MTDFDFPERYLVLRYQVGDLAHGAYVPATELERLEHEWDQYIETRKDRRVSVPRLSGEVLSFRISELLVLAEQTRQSIELDYTIDALDTQVERAVKRAVLGPDYDPDRD